MAVRSDIRRMARERLGFDELRPGQEEAAAAILGGRDVLAVMPTGSGKSAIYAIAGVLRPGATVVVSPLLALQRDQVENLEELEVGGAAELNSTQRAAERRETLESLEGDELEFVFLAPEQFANEETLDTLRKAEVSLFVVDEAHCISEWGHDFRPDYLRLGAVAEQLGRPPILALTATASPPIRAEIVERLGLDDPEIVSAASIARTSGSESRRFETRRRSSNGSSSSWWRPRPRGSSTRRRGGRRKRWPRRSASVEWTRRPTTPVWAHASASRSRTTS
jgi:ATP-dependent DNA helicase RecQ